MLTFRAWTTRRACLVVLLAIFAAGFVPGAACADDAVRLEPLERWSNHFGGRDVELRIAIKTSRAFEGRVGWGVTIDRATVARRETTVAASPDKPGTLVLRFTLPPVRDGVVLRADLGVHVLGADGKTRASLEKVLWLFPQDPFAGRAEYLKTLKVTLFDPEHTTAPVLTKAGVPFDEQNNQAALADLREGLLLIGEGVSFKDEPRLAETMARLAGRGIPVLCLAPAGGTLALPGAGKAVAGGPENLSLRRRRAIAGLDKRLDTTAWPPDGSVVMSSLILTPDEGGVAAEVVRGEEGWPWLEMEFNAKRGRLIVCGFGIMTSWSSGPTPRFLFAALLERLLETDKTEPGTPKGAEK